MNRRSALKTSSLAFLGLSLPNTAFAVHDVPTAQHVTANDTVPKHYPNISPEIIAEVVGKSHFDIERVKALVNKRPELSRAVWEWRFGDFESAIGAASHVGRRDIVQYLMSKGARPTIFTFAMLGNFKVITSIIEAFPGIQEVTGPHGISLLDHAYAGERMKDTMTPSEVENLEQTIDYLMGLGNASGNTYIEVNPEEQEKYLGDYKYGDGENEGFTVAVNMRKLLSLAPIGGFGGALYKIDENKFIYNGTSTVFISFDIREDKVYAMTVSDPDVTIEARKIS